MKKALGVLLGITLGLIASTGAAAAQAAGEQRFVVLVYGFGGQETTTVIAVGPITGVGTFEETEDEDLVRFVFPEGSVTLNAPSEDESEEFDEFTCTGRFTFSGPWEIVGGTGAYEDATGSGRFEGQGRFVGQRDIEGCSEDENAGFFLLYVEVTGTVSLNDQAAA